MHISVPGISERGYHVRLQNVAAATPALGELLKSAGTALEFDQHCLIEIQDFSDRLFDQTRKTMLWTFTIKLHE